VGFIVFLEGFLKKTGGFFESFFLQQPWSRVLLLASVSQWS